MSRVNFPIFITSILISLVGLVTLLSTELTSTFSLTWSNIFVKQTIFVLVGIAVMVIMTKFDYTYLKYRPVIYGLYAITLLLLLLTIIFGQEVNGAKRWLSLLGTQIQPSEIAKITVIITTAYIFNTYKEGEIRLLLRSLLFALPITLLVYVQPHGSMSILLLFLWFITAFFSMKDQFRNIMLMIVAILNFFGLFMLSAFNQISYIYLTISGIVVSIFMFFAKDRWRLPVVMILVLSIILGGVGSLIWNNVLGEYQRSRVVAFLNPQSVDSDVIFNVEQSKIAIGSGGVLGKGFANGTQSKLQFLPFHQTDFIFAAYAEQFGLVGSIILLALFFILFWNIFIFPIDYPKIEYESILVVVLGLKILTELIINLGTNIGLTPATGIPMPLMSAGGTITIMTFFSLGLIQSIINKVKKEQVYIARD